MKSIISIFLIACFFVAGCASKPQLNPSSEFAPIQPIPKAEEQRITGGIFDSGNALLGSKRTYRVGDLKVGDLVKVLKTGCCHIIYFLCYDFNNTRL